MTSQSLCLRVEEQLDIGVEVDTRVVVDIRSHRGLHLRAGVFVCPKLPHQIRGLMESEKVLGDGDLAHASLIRRVAVLGKLIKREWALRVVVRPKVQVIVEHDSTSLSLPRAPASS